jgi:hypothetical protein
MNTYAVKPLNPFVPVFFIRAFKASEALEAALTLHAVHGIWQVKNQGVN